MGSLDATVDFPLLTEVAAALPHISFVLVGQSDQEYHDTVRELAESPNVHWLGRKPWSDLPAYLWGFDVGIIPFALTDFTAGGSPLKLFEYLAAGLAVVATRLEFADVLKPYIRIADTASEFAALVQAACEGSDDRAKMAERTTAIEQGFTWDARVEELSSMIGAICR